MNPGFPKLFLASCLGLLVHLTQAQRRPAFPLQASPNGRYLVDQQGTPFLYQAHTGWLIFSQLTLAEAQAYLTERQQQGYNTIQVQISFNPDSANRAGQRPLQNDDFTRPNEPYFAHVERVVRVADSLGILLNIAPFWIGCCREGYGVGGNEVFAKNGTAKTRQMGEYLGKRFGRYKNILWTMGGDNDPRTIRREIEAMAEGLRATAPQQLITYHASAPHSSTDLFQYAPWLGFSMIYTYWREKPKENNDPQYMVHVYEAALREYNKSDRMPFVLGEAQYEGDGRRSRNDIGTAQHVRRQAWWTMLCGGAGHAYGGDGWNLPADWRTMLRYPGGGEHLRHVRGLLETLPWWQLVPDQRHTLLVAGYGEFTKPNYVTAAATEDKTLLVAYLPEPGLVTLNLGQLKGPRLRARWFDPRTGQFLSEQQVPNEGLKRFLSPFQEDWVLIVQTVP
jgi:hypothetical protein